MNYLKVAKAKLAALESSSRGREMGELYSLAVDRIDQMWAIGTYDRLNQKFPEHSALVEKAIKELDQVWTAVSSGEAQMEDFRTCLSRWEECHIQVLQLLNDFPRSNDFHKAASNG